MPRELPWIVLRAALLVWSENVCGEPGITTLIAAPQVASVVGLTNEPTSALTATYSVSRATNPPASAPLAPPERPRGFRVRRAAPSSVTGRGAQSTPTSPSTLLARAL